MQRWPWITLLLAAVVAAIGHDFIYSAFFSSEQLARNIARPLVFIALAVAAVAALIEFGIRAFVRRAR